MKTQMKRLLGFLTLLALFSVPHPASAYYDPGMQRWINRDPLATAGIKPPQFLYKPEGSFRAFTIYDEHGGPGEKWPWVGANLYRYDENCPINQVDPYGDWTLGIGIFFSFYLGPVVIGVNSGIVFDTQGNISWWLTGGGGAGGGAGVLGRRDCPRVECQMQ